MASEHPNHYEILGLSQKATAEEIKQRFRALARRWHPDVAKSEDATERFKAINEAYRVLGDPERRANYDSELKLASSRAASTASPRATGSARTSSTHPRPQSPQRDRGGAGPQAARRPSADASARTYAVGRLLADAQAAMSRMRLNEAAGFCRAVLELDRRNPLALEILGDIARVRGRADQALAYYTMAIQGDPVNMRLQAKFEELARQPRPGATVSSRGTATGLRQATIVTVGLTLITVLFALANAVASSDSGSGWAPWDWNPGMLLGLITSGFIAGLIGRLSGMLRSARLELMTPPPSNRQRSAVPMGLILVMMSLVCFWLAGLVYVIVAAAQEAASSSIITAFAVCSVVVALYALLVTGVWLPVLLLGGNLVFPAFVGGWALGDSNRR
jgi:curved DNA-binding protein CbpA